MFHSSTPPEIDVSVVVPVFGGSDALAELHRRLADSMAAAGLSWELILVDDRGRAQSWPAIRSLANSFQEVTGLRLSRNFGQHAATICGIEHARGRWIITMDDDLEHPPEAIASMLAAGSEETPLVYGLFPQRTHSGVRNLSSELMRWTLKRAFPELNEHYSSFRAIHAPLARQLTGFRLARPYIDGMLSWMTSSATTVEVTHGEREHGESAYTWRKLISHAINIFVTFSHLPLRIASYGGAAIAAISFLYMMYVVYGYFSGHISNPGYTSLMSVILFACGIQLLILGVLGEYLGRLMGATYRKPVYLVEAHAGCRSGLDTNGTDLNPKNAKSRSLLPLREKVARSAGRGEREVAAAMGTDLSPQPSPATGEGALLTQTQPASAPFDSDTDSKA